MAVAYVASAGGSGNLGGDPTVTKPGSVVDGHLLVAFVCTSNGAANAPTAPSGWSTHGSSLSADFRIDWKIASSEPSSWVWSTPGISNAWVVVMVFSGVDTSNPFGEILGTNAGNGTGNIDLTGLTPTATYLVNVVTKAVNSGTWTPPGSVTEDFDFTVGGGLNYSVAGGHETVTAGVGTGTRSWDPSNTGNNLRAGYLFTINPTPIPATVNPPAAASTAGGSAPAASATASPAGALATATAGALVPTVISQPPDIVVPAAAASATALAPKVGPDVTAPAAAASATALAPKVGPDAAPAPAAATAGGLVPVVSADARVDVPAASATATPGSGVIAAGSATMYPPTAQAIADGPNPVISSGASLSAPAAAAAAEAIVPSVGAHVSIQPAPAAATAAGPVPVVSAGASLSAPAAAAAAGAIVPNVGAHATRTPPPAAATAAGHAPVLTAFSRLYPPPAQAQAFNRPPAVNLAAADSKVYIKENGRKFTLIENPRQHVHHDRQRQVEKTEHSRTWTLTEV